MLKYPCLVLDHDDTVVQSEATINYPYFCYILNKFRPGTTITLEEYICGCCHQGFADMCRTKFHFTDEELHEEYIGWKEYMKNHIPLSYQGISEVIKRQKEAGGLVCVVSHSGQENISRDYLAHFGILPDDIYGWDFPEDQRKPSPYPLLSIMKKYHLKPEELIVIDDMKPAWEMAKAAGVAIGFAKWSKESQTDICRDMEKICDYSFASPQDLEQFLFSV